MTGFPSKPMETKVPPNKDFFRRKSSRKHQVRRENDEIRRDSCMSAISLASFTSANSISSDPGKIVEIGNLRFLNDNELEDGRSSILGRGSFAMVRLAWRRTPMRRLSTLSSLSGGVVSDDEDSLCGKPEASSAAESSSQFFSPIKKFPKLRRGDSKFSSSTFSDDEGELVAVKIFQKSILKQCRTIEKDDENHLQVRTALENVEREIAVMKMLQHPNLVCLHEVIDSAESDKLFMVIEYVSLGEIMTHVRGTDQYKRRPRKKGEPNVLGVTEKGHFDERHSALFFVDILHGLAHLHRNHIVHRDLKPENILLDPRGFAKISDFGVSHLFEDEISSVKRASAQTENLISSDQVPRRRLTRGESDAALMMKKMSDRGLLTKTEGTWCFWSPEMCAENSLIFSGYACDLWAAGVCLYIFATGKLPFFSEIPLALYDMIAEAKVELNDYGLSDTLIDMLRQVLARDPAERAGLGDCLKHPFCVEAREQRLRELGDEVGHKPNIVVRNDDLRKAFSVTKAPSARALADGLGRGLQLMRQRLSNRSMSPKTWGMDDIDENDSDLTPQRSRMVPMKADSSSLGGFVGVIKEEQTGSFDSDSAGGEAACAIQ